MHICYRMSRKLSFAGKITWTRSTRDEGMQRQLAKWYLKHPLRLTEATAASGGSSRGNLSPGTVFYYSVPTLYLYFFYLYFLFVLGLG